MSRKYDDDGEYITSSESASSEEVEDLVPESPPRGSVAHVQQFELSRYYAAQALEFQRPKTHWDHVLEEMLWVSMNFELVRKWKIAQAKRIAEMMQQATSGEKKGPTMVTNELEQTGDAQDSQGLAEHQLQIQPSGSEISRQVGLTDEPDRAQSSAVPEISRQVGLTNEPGRAQSSSVSEITNSEAAPVGTVSASPLGTPPPAEGGC